MASKSKHFMKIDAEKDNAHALADTLEHIYPQSMERPCLQTLNMHF